ncbi:MAG: hypothetical protein IJS26_02260 [Alphaproteobacteria bacterium]|nr:hypothetical protein [Alphaproteobacteria bacterium]
MTQEKRHEIAEQFRQQIERPMQRAEAIRTLIAKPEFDESDKMRIRELLRRVDYADPCEQEYMELLARLFKEDSLRPKAEEFYKRWNA